jgi:hypothetical protein
MNTVKSMLRGFRWSEGPLEVGLEATNVTHVSKNLHAACQWPETLWCWIWSDKLIF